MLQSIFKHINLCHNFLIIFKYFFFYIFNFTIHIKWYLIQIYFTRIGMFKFIFSNFSLMFSRRQTMCYWWRTDSENFLFLNNKWKASETQTTQNKKEENQTFSLFSLRCLVYEISRVVISCKHSQNIRLNDLWNLINIYSYEYIG